MRKNRKMPKKMSVCTSRAMNIGGLVILMFAVVIFNLLATAKCRELERDCGEKEKKLRQLNDDCERELAHWEVMKTSEGLEAALRRHGLAMHYPNPSQTIRMRSNGTPYAGQLSMAKVAQRANGVATANYKASSRRRR